MANRVYAWLTIAILLVAFGLGVVTLARQQRQLAAAFTPGALLAGRAAAAVNQVMAHDLPIGPALLAAGGVLRWRVFGSGGPQVTVGCGGWLYLTEELRPWPGGDAAMQRRAAAVRAVAAGLAAQRIALQVLLVPDKARVATEGACGLPYSAQSQARYGQFLALLGGVHATDLRPVFTGVATPLFYRTDTHWNQDGAALAAAAVASESNAALGPEQAFRTQYGPDRTRAGDLLRLMGLEDVPDFAIPLRPRPDHERPASTSAVHPPAPAADLLDDAPVPEVVLLGSSFSLNGNFQGALEQSLSAPVAQFAEAGGGFWGAARDYFRSPAFGDTPPKLVIWEIPERVVNQPVGADEARFLDDWRGHD